MQQIIAGTGHRWTNKDNYSEDDMINFMKFLKISLKKHYFSRDGNPLPDEFIVGGALGFDMALAQFALESGVPYTLVAPGDWFGKNWSYTFKNVLEHHAEGAKEVILVDQQEKYKYLLPKGSHATKMQWRNEWMVDNATGVLAYWNGYKNGGTYNTIKYLEKNDNKTFTNLWSSYPHEVL